MASPANARQHRRREAPAPRPSAPRPKVLPGGGKGIRWDRVGRMALLVVLVGMAYLYVGPAVSFFETVQESKTRAAEVSKLEAQKRALEAKRRALSDPVARQAEARRLGYIKPGERPFIIKDPDKLPKD